MEERVGISEKAFTNLPRLPGFGRNVQRHVNHDGSADDIVARDAAPEAAVIGIAAIVAHGEITIVGNAIGESDVLVTARRGTSGGRPAPAAGEFFDHLLAVSPHRPVADSNRVSL